MKFCKVCKDYLSELAFGRRSNTCKECKRLGSKALPTVRVINNYSFAPKPTIRAETIEDWPREGFPNVLHYM